MSRILGILLVAACAGVPAAGQTAKGRAVTILWLDKTYAMHVNLSPIGPLKPPLRAILAYYAMRAGSGCPAGDWQGGVYKMRCGLTTALNLGDQCSPEHLSLVKKWFPDGLPSLAEDPARVAEAVKNEDWTPICNNVPDTATRRNQWDLLRLKIDGDLVEVHAVESWTGGPGSDGGQNQYDTTYRVLPDRVRVLRHSAR